MHGGNPSLFKDRELVSPGVNPLDPEERLSTIKRGGYEGGGTKTLQIKDRMFRLARSGQGVPVR
jgi:hypothetical protein